MTTGYLTFGNGYVQKATCHCGNRVRYVDTHFNGIRLLWPLCNQCGSVDLELISFGENVNHALAPLMDRLPVPNAPTAFYVYIGADKSTGIIKNKDKAVRVACREDVYQASSFLDIPFPDLERIYIQHLTTVSNNLVVESERSVAVYLNQLRKELDERR